MTPLVAACQAALRDSPSVTSVAKRNSVRAVTTKPRSRAPSSTENVLPHPGRRKRFEQKTRLPRITRTPARSAYPRSQPCPISAPVRPQCGHGQSLRCRWTLRSSASSAAKRFGPRRGSKRRLLPSAPPPGQRSASTAAPFPAKTLGRIHAAVPAGADNVSSAESATSLRWEDGFQHIV